MGSTLTLNTDLDQSGTSFQRVRVYSGPTLGWMDVYDKPSQVVTLAGTTTLIGPVGTVLVNVAGAVTLNLPMVASYIQQSFGMPAVPFERLITVKDIGGNANTFHITIVPNGTDKIDGVNANSIIATNFGVTRFYPLNDMSGWYSG
jgi:hypothetical protein